MPDLSSGAFRPNFCTVYDERNFTVFEIEIWKKERENQLSTTMTRYGTENDRKAMLETKKKGE